MLACSTLAQAASRSAHGDEGKEKQKELMNMMKQMMRKKKHESCIKMVKYQLLTRLLDIHCVNSYVISIVMYVIGHNYS